jgi:hypothetical protein
MAGPRRHRAHTVTRTTPAGRQITTTLDDRGRGMQIEVPGILPVNLSYDKHGRLKTASQDERTRQRVGRGPVGGPRRSR